MKRKILIILIYLICINSYSQFGSQQIIEESNTIEKVVSVSAVDIDGDGNLDILCASSKDDIVFWYKNTDGLGTFGTKKIITTSVDEPNSVSASDIDGDGDLDVISASSRSGGKIAWYENTDGLGNFGTQQIIENIPGAKLILTADLDGDGDLDIVSGVAGNPGEISWNKNTNGLGTFDARQIITTSLDQLSDIFAIDLDGDGDIDLLSASGSDDKIAWYENTNGLGTFGAQQIITSIADGATSVFASDIDSDGDIDVISTSWLDDKVYWFENTNGQGSFNIRHTVASLSMNSSPFDVYSTDVDGDSDMDIIVSLIDGDKIVWFENTDGLGGFGSEQVIVSQTDGPYSIYSADIDGDGDMDVVSGHSGFNTGKVAWYENTEFLSLSKNTLVNFSIFPNPTVNILTINSKTQITQIEIYNNLGQLILSNSTAARTNNNKIDVSKLNQGIYFIKIKDINGDFGNTKILKI